MSQGVRKILTLTPLWLTIWASAPGQGPAVSSPPGPELVQHALEAELRALQDTSHPMRFQLRKSSPRLVSTKEIVETRDGSVAMLLSVNDQPLSQSDAQQEQERLNALLADPGKQRHRKQGQDEDMQRAAKVLRELP